MRIAIDIRSLMEPYQSGVAHYTYHLLNHLLKIDSENQYFLFYNSFSDVSRNLPHWDYPNVHLIGCRYPNKILNLCLKMIQAPKLDQLLVARLNQSGIKPTQIDLFFLPNLNFIALKNQTKKIITVHDLSFELFPEFYSIKRRLWHKIINPRKLITSADQIIAVSENTKNDLIDFYQLPIEKIKVIYSGVDESFRPINDQKQLNRAKEKYRLPKNFIFYLGNLEPRKNIEGLIEAFEILKDKNSLLDDYQLLIAGSPSWSYENIYHLANQSKYREAVRFIGYVDLEDKPALYNLAKLFVYPSFYEGFGFPPLEALASGLPVVASSTSSLGEIIGSAGLLVDPYNRSELAEAMYQILTNETLKTNLQKRGPEQARKFRWADSARAVLDLFTQFS